MHLTLLHAATRRACSVEQGDANFPLTGITSRSNPFARSSRFTNDIKDSTKLHDGTTRDGSHAKLTLLSSG
jgi:hypothetical protein